MDGGAMELDTQATDSDPADAPASLRPSLHVSTFTLRGEAGLESAYTPTPATFVESLDLGGGLATYEEASGGDGGESAGVGAETRLSSLHEQYPEVLTSIDTSNPGPSLILPAASDPRADSKVDPRQASSNNEENEIPLEVGNVDADPTADSTADSADTQASSTTRDSEKVGNDGTHPNSDSDPNSADTQASSSTHQSETSIEVGNDDADPDTSLNESETQLEAGADNGPTPPLLAQTESMELSYDHGGISESSFGFGFGVTVRPNEGAALIQTLRTSERMWGLEPSAGFDFAIPAEDDGVVPGAACEFSTGVGAASLGLDGASDPGPRDADVNYPAASDPVVKEPSEAGAASSPGAEVDASSPGVPLDDEGCARDGDSGSTCSPGEGTGDIPDDEGCARDRGSVRPSSDATNPEHIRSTLEKSPDEAQESPSPDDLSESPADLPTPESSTSSSESSSSSTSSSSQNGLPDDHDVASHAPDHTYLLNFLLAYDSQESDHPTSSSASFSSSASSSAPSSPRSSSHSMPAAKPWAPQAVGKRKFGDDAEELPADGDGAAADGDDAGMHEHEIGQDAATPSKRSRPDISEGPHPATAYSTTPPDAECLPSTPSHPKRKFGDDGEEPSADDGCEVSQDSYSPHKRARGDVDVGGTASADADGSVEHTTGEMGRSH
ncbi:hypothetical protein BDK51DRAFT_33591 [Blyttiomyces helicus]|uniref:Uncharacterized protein n=1 Tax=Blyttiomyces helicus TaxID=388810 RepID=A0A4P9W8U7_9FUNG|nr:hypothetical protein BDK51DRAFT_33591 [Blyttiomyces helicus]|eukprot:RKO88959.1 hypothetical protein BDK51DRAFT_33591 [Blyttiomyces helicus]